MQGEDPMTGATMSNSSISSLRRTGFWLLVGALCLLPLLGHAQGRDAFEEAYGRGKQLYRGGDNQAAIVAFEAAYALDPVPGVLFNIGQAHLKLGHPAEALRYYERYLAEMPRLAPRDRRKVDLALADARAQLAAGAPPVSPVASVGVTPPTRIAAGAPPVSPAASVGAAPPTRIAAASAGAAAPAGVGAAPAEVAAPANAVAAPAGGAVSAAAPALTASLRAPRRPPIYRRWWFWGAVGLVTAGAVVGAVVATTTGGATAADPFGGAGPDHRWKPEF